MSIYEPDQFIIINTIITFVILEDFSKDNLNMIINNLLGLIRKHLHELLFSTQKLIINPLNFEVIVLPL
jgi:hypothetical protein